MGRNLQRNQSALQFEKYYRGCIWGLFPLQFQSFKKLLPHINQKHVRTSKSGPKNESNEDGRSSDSSFTAIENTDENISVHKSKENRRRKGKVPQRPRLGRTYSIHHLEPKSNYLDDSNGDLKHPGDIHKISRDPDEADNVVSHTRMCATADMLDDELVAWNSEHLGEQDLLDQAAVDADCQFSGHGEFPYEDFFDVFQIDKKLLMKSSQNLDSDDYADCQVDHMSSRRATFRRSGSFPMANKPCNRYGSLIPSKLESKLTEVWPSPFPSSSSSTYSSSFHCSENILPRSRSSTVPINMFGDMATEKATQYETDHRAGDYATNVRRYKLSRMGRASSLNESLERYTQLFETSFRTDAKLNISKSLRLSNEDEVGFNPSASVCLRKVQSIPEVLQVEWRPENIKCSKVPDKSASFIIESEQSDLGVNKDESCCSISSEPRLLDELQMKLGFDEHIGTLEYISNNSDPHSDSLQWIGTEDIKLGTSDQDDFLWDVSLRTEGTVSFTLEQNALKIFEALGTGNSPYKSTEPNNDLGGQLLFDLVNEALLDIYNGFDAYWPAPLCSSSNCHMHPLPIIECHITRKIQSRIQKLQSFSLKTSNSMDNVVSFDLTQGDGWMNLQAEAESLGLALDELIFDELIEELVYE